MLDGVISFRFSLTRYRGGMSGDSRSRCVWTTIVDALEEHPDKPGSYGWIEDQYEG